MKNLIVASIIFATLSASADWKWERITDEMTDDVHYFLSTSGHVYQVSDLLTDTPVFCLRLKPVSYDLEANKTRFRTDTQYIGLAYDRFVRGYNDVSVRVGKEPMVNEQWESSTDRACAFMPKSSKMVLHDYSEKQFKMRFETSLGAIRTLSFDVPSISNVLDAVKQDYLSLKR